MKSIKGITKWLLGAAMAGAFILAAPHKADAQVVVQVGAYGPVPAYYAPGYGWRRREYFEHRRWERDHWRYERFHDRRW